MMRELPQHQFEHNTFPKPSISFPKRQAFYSILRQLDEFFRCRVVTALIESVPQEDWVKSLHVLSEVGRDHQRVRHPGNCKRICSRRCSLGPQCGSSRCSTASELRLGIRLSGASKTACAPPLLNQTETLKPG